MRLVEPSDAPLNTSRNKAGFELLEGSDGRHHGIACLLLKENAGCRVCRNTVETDSLHGLRCTASRVGDHWPAERHGLPRHDAKVFPAGKQKRAAMRILLI